MSAILIEFDNILEKTEITMPLVSSSKQEGGDNYTSNGGTDQAQTAVFGIQVPIIMINNTIIDFDSVVYFELKSKSVLPELIITVEDRYELINNIDKPGHDNEVRIQLLPKFDNAYKKIDLTFFINSIQVSGKIIRLTCSYKLPMLKASQYKTFGEIDTHTLFKTVAQETKLGFATNVSTMNDLRYAYCNNISYLDLLNNEIKYANSPERIMDWWVDLWNNINLVDIKDRYETVDSNEELEIWITKQLKETTADVEIKPIKVTATLINHPGMADSEMYFENYEILNKPGANAKNGSDRVYSIYDDNKGEYIDYLIQDGDIKKDIFMKYQYLGESYGEYNYLLSQQIRQGYLQKINSEQIKVSLKSPLLALMRGHKVNFVRYVNDDIIEQKMKALEDAGVIDRNIESNIPLSDYQIEEKSGNGNFRIDRTSSGQYLITAVNVIYNNNRWDYKLTLTKPASTKASIVKNN